MAEPMLVSIVDDDQGVRNALYRLLRNAGMAAEVHDSAAAFLEALRPEHIGCLLLDIRMPGMDGLALQAELTSRGVALPLIFLTGEADVTMAVQAMRAGALDFVQKPFDNDDLLQRVRHAIAVGQQMRLEQAELTTIRERRARLTPRELEVMALLVQGLMSKQIADRLDVSPRTVEIHRGRIMSKMEARSLADLVRMSIAARDR